MCRRSKSVGTRFYIEEPIEYLKKRFGTDKDFTLAEEKLYRSGKEKLLHELETGASCCTLGSVYNLITIYNSRNGYTQPQAEELYAEIRGEALKLGYKPQKGVSVFKIARFANLCYRRKKIEGFHFRNHFFMSKRKALELLETGGPFIYSLASGYYFNHTLLINGYRKYLSAEGKSYYFLSVLDGWTGKKRFLAWKGTGAVYIAAAVY